MSIALIDNASLSSVQRVLGYIQVKNKSTIDGDLCAFENFINSILFYNELVAIDDYKKQYSLERKKAFDYITFIDPSLFNGDEIESCARVQNNDIIPQIHGGKFSDDAYETFFDLLRVNIQCTWDISSSIYYLTLKMLGESGGYEFEKFGNVCHSIFSELSESKKESGSTNSTVQLVDRYGNIIGENYHIPKAKWGDGSTGGMTSGLSAFIAALSWLSYKSIYYTYYADYLRADTFLHPIRQNFQMYFYDKVNKYDSSYISGIISQFNSLVDEELSTIIGSQKHFTVNYNMPHFLTYIISKTKDPSKIIEYAFEMRDGRAFLEAREHLGIIRNLYEEGKTKGSSREIAKIKSDLQGAFNEIRRDYGVSTAQGDISSKLVNAFNAISGVFKLPRMADDIKDSRITNLITKMANRKSFSMIYRDISKELLNIQKLGKYHDLLVKNVSINKDIIAYYPKTESPMYINAHSQWKSPM